MPNNKNMNLKENVLVIVQARTNSKRLPRKSLLKIQGIPSAVLCVKRAENNGLKVILATSSEATDDELYQTARDNDVTVYRGSLNNVLERFAKISQEYSDKDIIIRLTGDNLFVDGNFIDMCLNEFIISNVDYMVTDMNKNFGFPYGMSCEIFKRDCLTAANNNAVTDFDKEHVTPYIEENFKCKKILFPLKWQTDLSGLICTVDTQDEFNNVSKSFENLDPINTKWVDLCYALRKICDGKNDS